MNNRPIIALDFAGQEDVALFLTRFPKHEPLFVKVGMELFYQEGPIIIKWLTNQGHDVFLDLKLHDIPNTVEKAMIRLAKLGIAMTNVHAAGGIEMMQAALTGLKQGSSRNTPLLIAVTQLTSIHEKMMHTEQLIKVPLTESVTHYAKCAHKAGLDGVVCSAKEADMIHRATDDRFICLTPGIRPHGFATGDQQRVVTPSEANKMGANYIVVGRPITQAVNPYQVYQTIKSQWNGASK